jgi:hypothetical protein
MSPMMYICLFRRFLKFWKKLLLQHVQNGGNFPPHLRLLDLRNLIHMICVRIFLFLFFFQILMHLPLNRLTFHLVGLVACWIKYHSYDIFCVCFLLFVTWYSCLFNVRYQNAVQWFELTLEHASSSVNEMWEPTLVNLGHALRKLK